MRSLLLNPSNIFIGYRLFLLFFFFFFKRKRNKVPVYIKASPHQKYLWISITFTFLRYTASTCTHFCFAVFLFCGVSFRRYFFFLYRFSHPAKSLKSAYFMVYFVVTHTHRYIHISSIYAHLS